MEFVEVTHHNLKKAAEVHAISWRQSHSDFCSEEFINMHTTEHQMKYLQKEIDDGKKVFMLVDEKAVGVVSVIEDLIENLYILPGEHAKGYGSELLKFAISKCQGTPRLWILSNNKRAHSLYLKNGFRETSNRKYHKEDLFEMEMKKVYDAQSK